MPLVIRLPADLEQQLRQQAENQHRSLNDLVSEAVAEKFSQPSTMSWHFGIFADGHLADRVDEELAKGFGEQ
jgi:hypothetical protein